MQGYHELITKAENRLDVPKATHLLGREWDQILADQDCLSPLLSYSTLGSQIISWRAVVATLPATGSLTSRIRRERPVGKRRAD